MDRGSNLGDLVLALPDRLIERDTVLEGDGQQIHLLDALYGRNLGFHHGYVLRGAVKQELEAHESAKSA